MATPHQHDPVLARTLIRDELLDLLLYKALRGITQDRVKWVLDE